MTIQYASAPTRYRGYEVPRPFREKSTRAQSALQKAAVTISKVYNEEEGPDVEERDSLLKELDGLFKSNMDTLKKADLLCDSVKSTIAYCNEHRTPGLQRGHGEGEDNDREDPLRDVMDNQVQALDEVFLENYQDETQKYLHLGQTIKYIQNPQAKRSYSNFRRAIFEASHDADEIMPDLDTYYDDYEQDQDFIVEQERIEYKCPLTKQFYVNPVTSELCGHSFEKDAIMALFTDQTTIKCPVPACAHFYSKSKLKEDSHLLEKANAQKQRQLKESQRRNQTLERV